MKRTRAIETFARHESEMTTKEQAWSSRYVEASPRRRNAPRRAAARRTSTPNDALETVTSEMAAIAEERARLETERAQHAEDGGVVAGEEDAAAARQNAGEHAAPRISSTSSSTTCARSSTRRATSWRNAGFRFPSVARRVASASVSR